MTIRDDIKDFNRLVLNHIANAMQAGKLEYDEAATAFDQQVEESNYALMLVDRMTDRLAIADGCAIIRPKFGAR